MNQHIPQHRVQNRTFIEHFASVIYRPTNSVYADEGVDDEGVGEEPKLESVTVSLRDLSRGAANGAPICINGRSGRAGLQDQD
ncbi:hypothetical protein QJS04_geneDACA009735 [Acorus gramineus]|uniref:Uncharacterized protein n=1 Tax=Acorus gramineus TaxID=55184 RepID=A0AAV9BAW6_ACOGR|nr:hypothetical protein QJS04_geneDACA009735 [Acorus gramineus]